MRLNTGMELFTSITGQIKASMGHIPYFTLKLQNIYEDTTIEVSIPLTKFCSTKIHDPIISYEVRKHLNTQFNNLFNRLDWDIKFKVDELDRKNTILDRITYLELGDTCIEVAFTFSIEKALTEFIRSDQSPSDLKALLNLVDFNIKHLLKTIEAATYLDYTNIVVEIEVNNNEQQ